MPATKEAAEAEAQTAFAIVDYFDYEPVQGRYAIEDTRTNEIVARAEYLDQAEAALRAARQGFIERALR